MFNKLLLLLKCIIKYYNNTQLWSVISIGLDYPKTCIIEGWQFQDSLLSEVKFADKMVELSY